jgi:hypothetical protein
VVASATIVTALTDAEPSTEPRVSPLWLPLTSTEPTAVVAATPVTTNNSSLLPKSEKAAAE